MSIKSLQDYTYISRYAQYRKSEKRREAWSDAIDRVRDMHLVKYAEQIAAYPEIETDIRWAFEQSRQKRVLGSQRALQFGGTPILKKNARMFNCVSSFCDRLRFFQEAFWLLLCGSGVGFSVQLHHVAKLPKFSNKVLGNSDRPVKKFVIPDSIEGWADSLGILLGSYFSHPEFAEYEGYQVQFDYSLIRDAGSPLSTGMGKAPGPIPLRNALEKIRKLLNSCLKAECTRLRPIDAYDIIMHASDAVLSGGIRRSACITLFSPDDEQMLKAKTGNWFVENPQRGRSNNSVVLVRNKTTEEEFARIMESVKEFGEPGFFWTDSTEMTTNPCVTGDTIVATSEGLRLATELINTQFVAQADGGQYPSTEKGFWKTGHRSVLNLKFKSGRQLSVTPEHKILTLTGWKNAEDIQLDEEVVINNHRPVDFHPGNKKEHAEEFAKGYCLGDFLAGSSQTKWSEPHIYNFACEKGCIKNNKKIFSREVISGSWEYLSGLVAGYFDADGSVESGESPSLKIYSAELDNLHHLQIILNGFGIYGLVSEKSHELIISCDNIEQFDKVIPIRHAEKLEKIKNILNNRKRLPNRTHFTDQLTHKEVGEVQDVYDCTVPEINAFDANGVYVHNCVEIGFWPVCSVTGESGWSACNLSELNGKKIKSKEDFAIAAKAGAIIGTLQAGYTDFDYLGPVTKRIVEREALLGVSITGMMDNPLVIFDEELQREMAEYILKINEELAPKLGILPTARATCTKPAGSTSCVLGTASGIHPHHAKRYLRRIQGNQLEVPLQWYKKFNPRAVEKSVWSANDTDEVVAFPIEVPDGAKTKNDLDAITLLEHVKLTYKNWVGHGKVLERCTQPWLNHNVSNTCFNSETRFFTSDGLKAFSDFKDGDVVNVLDYRGIYVPATVKYFGKQPIWELVLSNGKSEVTINTTMNHTWLAVNKTGKFRNSKKYSSHLNYRMVKTYDLENIRRSYQIPKVFAKVPITSIDKSAFCHGFVFGDGSKHYAKPSTSTHVAIYDECKKDLVKIFKDVCPECSVIDHEEYTYVGKLSSIWKELPNTNNPEYLYGFIAGWFAADGYISSVNDNQRQVSICSFRKNLEWLIEKAQIAGIGTSGCIREVTQGLTGYIPGKKYYRLNLIKNSLTDVFFSLHENKYQRWLSQKPRTQNPKYYTIVSCKKTNRIEDVYCVVEPNSATFVLENNILTHNCTVNPNEWNAVRDYIYENREYFAGISLLPASGDKDYQQAPMVAVFTPREIQQMYGDGSMMASGLIVDGLKAFNDNLWDACDASLGFGKPIVEPELPSDTEFMQHVDYITAKEEFLAKKDWVRRAMQFAERYFEGDVKKMTYCLKDVHNLKLFLDLKREHVEVDYSLMVEENESTERIVEWACSGQGCILT